MKVTASEELEHLCRQLLSDIERWLPEVDPEVRSTLWHGVFTKAAKQADRLYQLCVEVALQLAGAAGPKTLAAVTKGKPPERLTMGERMDVLKSLDRQRVILGGKRIISKTDQQLLEDLTALRNHFTHGAFPSCEGPENTQRFLELARQLCGTQLLQYLVGERA